MAKRRRLLKIGSIPKTEKGQARRHIFSDGRGYVKKKNNKKGKKKKKGWKKKINFF